MKSSHIFTESKQELTPCIVSDDWKVISEEGTVLNFGPMTDIFVQYIFKDSDTTQTFVLMSNIFITFLNKRNKNFELPKIMGEVKLETQWDYIMEKGKKKRTQDFRLQSFSPLVDYYIEIQQDTHTKPKLELRAQDYFTFGIHQNKDARCSHQIWLLGEGYPLLLKDRMTTTYILKEQELDLIMPYSSSISFINLQEVVKYEKDIAYLAKYLLTGEVATEHPVIRGIIDVFEHKREVFKNDKEAIHVFQSWKDKKLADAEARGEARGEAKAMYKWANKSIEEISKFLNIPLEQIQEWSKAW